MLQLSMAYNREDSAVVKEAQAKLYESDKGIESLSERELLCLILGAGTKNTPLESLVNQVLDMKQEYGLKNLTPEYLRTQINGLTIKKAEVLLAGMELGRRVYSGDPALGKVIRSPEDAASIFDELKDQKQEHFVAIFLNTKNVVIGKKTIFVGSLNASIVHPRELFNEAIKRNAASIIVAHGHPSGDSKPSRQDIDVTKRIVSVGELIGIPVLDHVVIGFNNFTSMKEKGYL